MQVTPINSVSVDEGVVRGWVISEIKLIMRPRLQNSVKMSRETLAPCHGRYNETDKVSFLRVRLINLGRKNMPDSSNRNFVRHVTWQTPLKMSGNVVGQLFTVHLLTAVFPIRR